MRKYSFLTDGRSIHENYGAVDLDKLDEADRVGVVRTAHGDLVFFVNGISQSVAASELPDKVWAVIDLYGKCAQVERDFPFKKRCALYTPSINHLFYEENVGA